MFKKILKWLVGAMVALIVTLALVIGGVLLFRTEPLAIIPGGRLKGEDVAAPVTDWNFTEQYLVVTLEVRPSDPYSVNTSSLLHDGVLYVPSGRGGDSRWAQFLLQDPTLRLRVGTKLYKARATQVEDPMLVRELYQAWEQRYPSQAERSAEKVAQTWFFRIDAG